MLFAALLGGAAVLALPVAHAQPAAANDRNAEQRFLIEQLTADKAMSVARERRLADEDQERLYAALAVKDRALRAAEVRAKGKTAELARMRTERDGIARQREQLITVLADRDRTLEAEVRAYREVVTGLALSPDPRKQAALRRFAEGEQRAALADLDLIADADRAARLKAVDLAEAADRRPAARLAVEALEQGKVPVPEVVARFERLTQLDPGVVADWLQLAWLYDTQGRLADTRRAADAALRAVATTTAPRPRAATLDTLGWLAMKGGELARAKALVEEALVLRRTLAKDHPTSAVAQRDVSVSLDRLGDVEVASGELARAKAWFEESLVIRQTLAKDHPTSAVAQRDAGVSLTRLGDVAVAAGDLGRAKALVEEALVLRRTLAKDHPTSAVAQRDVSVSLNRLGEVAVAAGDLGRAKALVEESLVLRRTLAKDHPTSAAAQRDASVSLVRLGQIRSDAALLEEALDIVRALDQEGRLAPTDRFLLDAIPKAIEAIP